MFHQAATSVAAIPVRHARTAEAPPAVEVAPRPRAALPLCDLLLRLADRHRFGLLLVVAGLYLAAFNGQWRISPDAGLYLSIGRNLAHGQGFTYLGHPNNLAYPGWPCLIALSFKLFGHSLVPVNATMLAISGATLAMVYRLVLLHRDRPTAVVVTLGTALTKTFFVYGFELWSDMPFAMGVTAFLAGYEGAFGQRTQVSGGVRPRRRGRWYDWALLVGGLATAMVMRPTMWPLLIAIAGTLLLDAVRGHLKWPTLAGLIAVVLMVAAACFTLDPRRSLPQFGGSYEQDAVLRVTTQWRMTLHHAATVNLPSLFQWVLSDVLFQVRLGPLNAVLSLLVLCLGVGLFRYRILWGMWFCCLLAANLLVQETLDRYFLPVVPLLVFAWWQTMVAFNRKVPSLTGTVAVCLLLGFGVIANGSKVGGIIIQQRRTPFLDSFNKGTYAVVYPFARELQRRVGSNAVIVADAPYGRVLSYISELSVVGAFDVTPQTLATRPVYVIGPTRDDIHHLLSNAGLVEGPALFTVTPDPGADKLAVALSLHRALRAPAGLSADSPVTVSP